MCSAAEYAAYHDAGFRTIPKQQRQAERCYLAMVLKSISVPMLLMPKGLMTFMSEPAR